jgi:hypothetical protein
MADRMGSGPTPLYQEQFPQIVDFPLDNSTQCSYTNATDSRQKVINGRISKNQERAQADSARSS